MRTQKRSKKKRKMKRIEGDTLRGEKSEDVRLSILYQQLEDYHIDIRSTKDNELKTIRELINAVASQRLVEEEEVINKVI